MRIEMMNTGILGVNTYIVFNDELNECVVIDAGGDFQRLSNYIAENGATCKAVLLTHGHFDHIGAAKEFQDNGAVVYIHKADENFTLTPSSAGVSVFGENRQAIFRRQIRQRRRRFETCGTRYIGNSHPGAFKRKRDL
ncbi:MAG: MBL fold metallo-hydrolase [Clostridia bacterium]